MNCKYHKESEAKYICEKCKQPICEECAVEVNGKRVCSTCIQDSLLSDRGEVRKGGFLESVLFFCFAVIPGAAHMYMNLFKRGFQLMITFIAAIVVFSYVNIESFIPLIMIPTWFFSFFDSYAIRRKLRRGEEVEDMLAYDYNIILQNKKYIGIAMVVLGLLGVTNALGYSVFGRIFGWGDFYWVVKRSVIPIALVAAGVYIILKSRKVKVEAEPFDNNPEGLN